MSVVINMDSKVIEVCAAVAFHNGRLLLATRRPGSALAGSWEYPGGKCASGETLESCIARELREEIDASVTRATELLSLDYAYPEKTVRLHFMLCEISNPEKIVAREGQRIAWVAFNELSDLSFAPADKFFTESVSAKDGLPNEFQVKDARTVRMLGAWLRGERHDDVKALIAKPEWLRVKFTGGKERIEMRQLLSRAKLHTVCESAKCPNMCDCWRRKTATFMVMGNVCTRRCHFCSVAHGKPECLDAMEPRHVAESVRTLGLRHAVLTCVTRDDLPDGGASHMAAVVQAIHDVSPETTVEVLVSDFLGKTSSVDTVLAAKVRVYGHNIETVERLTPSVRSVATYRRSLEMLTYAAAYCGPNCTVKSGLMLGLGETDDEIRQTLKDLRGAGVEIVTIGQYLQPTPDNLDVERLVTPEEFTAWEQYAERELGFRRAVCGPLVRSSYMAEEAVAASRRQGQ